MRRGFLISVTYAQEELNKIRDDVSWLQLPVVVVVTPDGTFGDTGVATRAAPHMSPDWP